MIRFAFVALLHLAVAASVRADETTVVTGSAARISSDAWTVTGFESSLEVTDAGLSGEFHIGSIALLESGQVFDGIDIACGSIVLTTQSVSCGKGNFSLALPGIGRQTIPGAFTYDRQTAAARIELSSVPIAGGLVRLDITASDAGFQGRYTGSQLQLDGLLELGAYFTDALSGYSAAGLADIAGTFGMPSQGPERLVLTAAVSDVSLANETGTVAADGVAGTVELDVTLQPDLLRLTVQVDSKQGEAYVEPVYASFSESPLHLEAEDVTTPDYLAFDIPRFRLQQEAILDVNGSATLRLPADPAMPPGISANVELTDSSIANLYTNLVKIAAAGTILGDLETDGNLTGAVSVVDSALRSVSVQIDDAIFDDRGGRFAIYGLDGNLDWSRDDDQVPGASRLSWKSGTVYTIIFGGASADLKLGGDDVELLTALHLPMLGGALKINELVLDDFGSDDATGRLDAELEPVQLGQLTGAFGWPAFSGRLSGRLPLLKLEENTITVGGTLRARAFDGTMEVANLRIEQPFGRVPRMQADVALRDLDLRRVTEVFSFGDIQGRLSGDVSGLTMQNWQPIAMDMHLYTPANDRSQHRISQRAVENLASVGGGGAGAVLSTGFLKFFDVFAYDRIGLRCVLKDGVCMMSGVGPARSGPQGRGYYLVKGSGLPRIDVVGFRDTVSWSRLVNQLAAISRGGSPTVN